MRPHFPMKTIEDIADKLPGAKFFSTLDCNSGFWQIPLDEESSELLTFNTPEGRYRFNRLPFGTSCSSELFQSIMTDIFQDLEGVEVLVDDILIWGPTKEIHDQRLDKVLDRCREKNLKLNKAKSQICMTKVTYMGHVLTNSGLKPDPKKIEAITKMKPPTNVKAVQEFLGCVNYLGRFIKNLSDITAPLRQLTEKKTMWNWTDEHDKSFNRLKQLLTEAPVLTYYDATKPLVLSVDSSLKGTGAVLLQPAANNKSQMSPVAFASKAFTETQQRWAQIEKELAAIVFGCDKFHTYIFGRKVIVQTDHKPLESIFKKPLHQTPMRLQKMLLKLQKYDLDVHYVRGTELHVADCLSRNFLDETEDDSNDTTVPISMVYCLPITPHRLEELKKETHSDKQFQTLKEVIQTGWPENKKDVDDSVREYWQYRDDLTLEDDLIFKQNRVVIPKSMRRLMLEKIHQSHQGIEKSKRLARDILFWPGMSAQITEVVERCQICAEHSSRNKREPLQSHEVPNRPWEKVGTDLFELNGKQYFLLVDYYSSYFEVDQIHSATSKTIVRLCKTHFARHGIPDEVVSDNGPCYTGQDFRQFTEEWQFKHTKVSPTYPQSNGKAEKTVGIVKQLLRKAAVDKQDIQLAILNYRNTPLQSTNKSPAQLLFSRRTKTLLPTKQELLKPKVVPNVADKIKDHHSKQKQHYDKGTKELQPLHAGQHVWLRKHEKWEKGIVLRKSSNPRSFIVQDMNGQEYTRNRRHLKADKTTTTHIQLDDDDDYPESTNPQTNVTQSVEKPQDGYRTRYGRQIQKPQYYGFT